MLFGVKTFNFFSIFALSILLSDLHFMTHRPILSQFSDLAQKWEDKIIFQTSCQKIKINSTVIVFYTIWSRILHFQAPKGLPKITG